LKNWLAISALSLGLAIALLTTNIGRQQPATTSVAEAAASAVTVTGQQCLTASDVRVAFNWNGLNEGSQWVDLSLTNNGFIPGTFVGIGPIASGQTSFAWDGILGGFTHYLRINTLTAYGWSISPTIVFTTRNDCALAISQTPRGVPATNFAVSQVCMPNGATRGVATWTSSNQGQQWLDDSAYNADYAPNSYVSMGPMAPGQNALNWDGLVPGTWHFARISTGTPSGWLGSLSVMMYVRTDCLASVQQAAAPTATAVPAATATTVPPAATPNP
jgi:hypothetical protein